MLKVKKILIHYHFGLTNKKIGLRRPGDSLESPAKRIRISVEEDGGPCDSADQIPPPMQVVLDR